MLEKTYTLATVGKLSGITYGTGVLIAVVLLVLAIVFVNMVKMQPGANGAAATVRSRRIIFWVLGLIAPAVTFILSHFVYLSHVKGAPAIDKYMTASIVATVVAFVLYVLLGLILSKVILKKGSFGTLF